MAYLFVCLFCVILFSLYLKMHIMLYSIKQICILFDILNVHFVNDIP